MTWRFIFLQMENTQASITLSSLAKLQIQTFVGPKKLLGEKLCYYLTRAHLVSSVRSARVLSVLGKQVCEWLDFNTPLNSSFRRRVFPYNSLCSQKVNTEYLSNSYRQFISAQMHQGNSAANRLWIQSGLTSHQTHYSSNRMWCCNVYVHMAIFLSGDVDMTRWLVKAKRIAEQRTRTMNESNVRKTALS